MLVHVATAFLVVELVEKMSQVILSPRGYFSRLWIHPLAHAYSYPPSPPAWRWLAYNLPQLTHKYVTSLTANSSWNEHLSNGSIGKDKSTTLSPKWFSAQSLPVWVCVRWKSLWCSQNLHTSSLSAQTYITLHGTISPTRIGAHILNLVGNSLAPLLMTYLMH